MHEELYMCVTVCVRPVQIIVHVCMLTPASDSAYRIKSYNKKYLSVQDAFVETDSRLEHCFLDRAAC